MKNKEENNTGYNEWVEKMPKGESHWKAKLTEHDVVIIKKLISNNVKLKVIAECFSVSHGAIKDISIGRNWKSINMENNEEQ